VEAVVRQRALLLEQVYLEALVVVVMETQLLVGQAQQVKVLLVAVVDQLKMEAVVAVVLEV
jgi:hypothetical protein